TRMHDVQVLSAAAATQGDATACLGLPTREAFLCVVAVSVARSNGSYCMLLATTPDRYNCLISMTINVWNATACHGLETAATRVCYSAMAQSSGDESYCDFLSADREYCRYQTFAMRKPTDTAACNTLDQARLRDCCLAGNPVC